MARARNIKPALFTNEVLGVADPLYTLLFEGLWVLADRAGRLEDRVLRIKAEIFPYREGVDVDAMLTWLSQKGFIVRYSVCESRYIEILNFTKHQNPHKNEKESEIPSASDGCIRTDKIGTATESSGTTRADSLSLDSGLLIPDPLTPPQASAPVVVDDLFAKFWKLYPVKKCKDKAQKAWAKLKVDDELFTLITTGLANQVASAEWRKDGGQFIPHPTTWLNGKRWEDEVKPSNVHQFPAPSAHTGFADRKYSDDLKPRENGTNGF